MRPFRFIARAFVGHPPDHSLLHRLDRRPRSAFYPVTVAIALLGAALTPRDIHAIGSPPSHSSSRVGDPAAQLDAAPPRAVLTGLIDFTRSDTTQKVALTLDLRGSGESELGFGPPASCKLGLRHVSFTPDGGHRYTIVPLKNGVNGMAPYCDRRLFQSISVLRDSGRGGAPSYLFKDVAPKDASERVPELIELQAPSSR
ncbi:hypothetical protein CDN99_25500 [Roseateles aquatilis]|uniref:Uncharacterized protein n=1 Tax=Roseateles aquatilis TaxID=431061 RepID=A0A246IUE0_9BURK|nr:hypothetical protein [Roseateles aquatilis]OWQ83824.1 hypothetical protein CDN99_25500 [Roseateles aquatilis]